MNVVLAVVMMVAILIGCGDYHGTDYFGEFFVIQFTAILVAGFCFLVLLNTNKEK